MISQTSANGCCLIATVKDEGPWLLEWIAHNLILGFQSIAIASNDCSDGTDLMLDRLQALGHLTHDRNHRPYGGVNVQFSAYVRLRRLPQVASARWMISLDADEFLNVKIGENTITALIDSLPPQVELVPIAWRIFGDSDLSGWVGPEICDAFTWAAAPGKRLAPVKSLIRDHHRVQFWGAHVPRHHKDTALQTRLKLCTADAAGTPIDESLLRDPRDLRNLTVAHQRWDTAQINHYMLKTKEMFRLKKLRGDADGAESTRARLDLDRAWTHNHNEVQDVSISATAPRRKAMLAQLLTDPELAELHASAVTGAQARLTQLSNARDD